MEIKSYNLSRLSNLNKHNGEIQLCSTKRFYLIGNGFDLHHHLPTLYSDYKQFAKEIDSDFVEKIDSILHELGYGSEEIDLWSSLEEYLGYFTDSEYDQHFDNALDSSETDMDRAGYYDDPKFFADEKANELKNERIGVRKYLKEWIDSIRIKNVVKDPFLLLSPKAFYLNFNYTKTLEYVYGIDSSKLCYIHVKNDEYILGHNRKRDLPFPNPDGHVVYPDGEEEFDDDIRHVQVKESLNEAYNDIFDEYYKNSKQLIKNNATFFKNIEDAELIYIMGLSLGKEDHVYLEYISSHAKKCKKIIVYVRKRTDIDKMDVILQKKNPSIKISYKIWSRAYEWIYKIKMFIRSLIHR